MPKPRLVLAAERARLRNGICSCWHPDADHCPDCGACPDLDGHFRDDCPRTEPQGAPMTRPHLLMLTLPNDVPDRRTALADLRTAACLSHGVALDDIDPATGLNHSLDAYLSSRTDWERQLTEDPDSPWVRTHSERARARWEAIRPKYLADHPWPEPPEESR